MNETTDFINESKAKVLARKIADEFIVSGKGYVFTKGKYLCCYRDRSIGIENHIYANSELEGIEVHKKLLNIQSVVYDSDKLIVSTPKKDSVTNPVGTKNIYGKSVPKERYRPIANDRFRYVTLLEVIYKEKVKQLVVSASAVP